MKKLIILVRHGKHTDGFLNDVGIEQIRQTAKKLAALITEDQTIALFASPFQRTIMSAEIIAKVLGVKDIIPAELISDDNYDEDLIFEFVKSKEIEADIIILVTHGKHVYAFPQYFSCNEWGKTKKVDLIQTGDAVIIDCENKELMHLKST